MRSIIGAAVVALTLSGCGDAGLAFSAYEAALFAINTPSLVASGQPQPADTACARTRGCVRSAAVAQE